MLDSLTNDALTPRQQAILTLMHEGLSLTACQNSF